MRIAAIVVTRNRLTLLKDCLSALRAQTRPPDEIIVINNDSDDGTGEWLGTQTTLTVFNQGNSGSAGGQNRGIKEAYLKGHDWFWCMDDDTLPDPDTLEKLLASPRASDVNTGFLCSWVVWKDGAPHIMNIPYIHPFGIHLENITTHKTHLVTHASFVSIMFGKNAVTKCGLPLSEMFVWGDDVEYTRRILNHHPGYLVLDSKVTHLTEFNAGATLDQINESNAWKFIYGLRNFMFLQMTANNHHLFIRYLKTLKDTWRNLRVISGKVRPKTSIRLLIKMLDGIFCFRPKIEHVKNSPTEC